MKYLLIVAMTYMLIACGSSNTAIAPAQTDQSAQVGSTMQPPNQAGQAQVRLNIFSGRTAPTWALPVTDTQALRDLFNNLTSSAQASAETGLGYQGFEVVLPGSSSGAFDTITVYKGVVKQTSATSTRLLADPDRKVEQFLALSAKPQS